MAQKYNILYVDDEADNLLAFRSVFRRFYNVYTATGGEEAMQMLKDQPVDLVLSDQRMPSMTGVELCENVMNTFPQTACIIVTGYSETQPLIEAIKTGKISRYITKPWNVEELKSILKNTLETTI